MEGTSIQGVLTLTLMLTPFYSVSLRAISRHLNWGPKRFTSYKKYGSRLLLSPPSHPHAPRDYLIYILIDLSLTRRPSRILLEHGKIDTPEKH